MKKYDAVIIGGGIIGSSIAYYLTEAGLKVALIEKKDLASGTSSSCDGNVLIADKQPGFDTELAYCSQQIFDNLSEELNRDFDYTQRGSIYLIESKEEWETAEKFVNKQRENGYSMRMMDYDRVHEDEPLLADDIIGGIEIDSDASIYPMALVYSLAEKAIKNGLHVYNYTEVVDISLNKGKRVKSVRLSNSEKIYCDNVINAAGVWAPLIGKMVGINIPIKPRQGQMLVAEKTFQIGKRKIVEFGYMMAKFGEKDYSRKVHEVIDKNGIAFVFEPTQANNFLIGSSRRFVGYDTRLSLDVMRGLAARAMRFFPVLKDINVIRGYSGLRPYVADHFPIVSAVDSIKGYYIAAGHEGDGIGLAPVTGKIIQNFITDSSWDLSIDKDETISKLSFSRLRD
ncbi:MAG TPA: FAD-dependent oxidoreductase [Halanaerobiales bacterium]|nr:FAD-dependent oxidoreductase [Halanaerobiales bacterium]